MKIKTTILPIENVRKKKCMVKYVCMHKLTRFLRWHNTKPCTDLSILVIKFTRKISLKIGHKHACIVYRFLYIIYNNNIYKTVTYLDFYMNTTMTTNSIHKSHKPRCPMISELNSCVCNRNAKMRQTQKREGKKSTHINKYGRKYKNHVITLIFWPKTVMTLFFLATKWHT